MLVEKPNSSLTVLSEQPISVFSILPDELILYIFHYLKQDYQNLSRVSLVCRSWHKISLDNTLNDPIKLILKTKPITIGKNEIVSGGISQIDVFQDWIAYGLENFFQKKFHVKAYNCKTGIKKKFKTLAYQNQNIQFIKGRLICTGYRQPNNSKSWGIKVIDFQNSKPKVLNKLFDNHNEKAKIPALIKCSTHGRLQLFDELGGKMLRIAMKNNNPSYTHYKSLIENNTIISGFNLHYSEIHPTAKSRICAHSIETGELLCEHYSNKPLGFIASENNFIVFSSIDGIVHVLDFNTCKPLYLIDKHKLNIQENFYIKDLKITNSCVFILATIENFTKVFIWNLLTETVVKILETKIEGQRWPFLSIDGDYAAICGGNRVELRNIESGGYLKSLEVDGIISALAFKSSGESGPYLIVGIKNGLVKIWYPQNMT